MKNKITNRVMVGLMTFMMIIQGVIPTTVIFAQERGENQLNLSDVIVESFDIIDGTHDNAKIDYKTQGKEGYDDYLNNPSKFTQPVGKDQKESELSLKLNFKYASENAIKVGDTLEIPVSLGDEFKNATFASASLRDDSKNEIGSYSYNRGKFILNFSGDYIKTGNVKSFSTTLNTSSVKVSNATQGTGMNGEKTTIYGKVLGSNIIAGYEKKNKENPTGPGELSLDNVQILDFKIIDALNGNQVIEYKKTADVDYNQYKNDPDKFANAVCQAQKDSKIKLSVKMTYEDKDRVLKEGDTLSIPVNYGGTLVDFSKNPLPLKDANENVLGKWVYKNGNIIITFGGDYIKENSIKKMTASFETGEMLNRTSAQTRSFEQGKKYVKEGLLGKDKIITPFEYRYIKAENTDKFTNIIGKGSDDTSDRLAVWNLKVFNDFYSYSENGRSYEYFNPYILQNNGKYKEDSLTGIYFEDTFQDCAQPPTLKGVTPWISGINDDGKVIEGWYALPMQEVKSLLKEVSQGEKSKFDIKNSLKDGEYCIYDNKDGTYTFMMKMWDTNGNNGLKYNDLPSVKAAGGVGSFLKSSYPEVFGTLKTSTIEKINEIYDGKVIQNVSAFISAYYNPTKEKLELHNTAKITTDKTGEKDYSAKAILTPPAGIGDAPADPLSVKLIKSDRKTGAALSDGFKFELQVTNDNGNTWETVDVKQEMLENGILNGDKTLTPDDKGIVLVKGLKIGKYRFFEKAHSAAYADVEEDNANPNSTKYPKSANSKVIELDNQGTGAVVAMYNEPNIEKTQIKVSKIWEGPEKDFVTVKLIADGKEVQGKTLTLNKAGEWKGIFKDLPKYNKDGREIEYDVEEVKIAGYESEKTGDVKQGFVLINKHTPPKKEVFKGTDTKNIDGQLVKPGQDLVYVITYKNTTDKDVDVTITDKIPAHTTFVSADNGGKYVDGKITWMKQVAAGETFKVTFVVKVNKDVNGQTLINTARVNDGVNDVDTNTTKNPTPKMPPTPQEKPYKPIPKNPPVLPETGDTLNLSLYGWMLLLSGLLFAFIGYKRKKHVK